ncbi:MAG: hypothetical protein JW866_07370 [Ignavibacteriales bacterium]|nr:hypothetical protein [Ignavibacteriales bacterium]
MKKYLLYLLIFLVIFLFAFQSLIFNLNTNLIDWYDYPYYVWVVNQNVEKITSLNFTNYFDTNAFYPNKKTLLFSDILLPQGVIASLFSIFTSNPIAYFNLTFIVTFLLNFTASYLFWREIFKKEKIAFLGSLLTVFSPYFHNELGHFQMQSFWPFFFSLYFLFRKNGYELKYLIFSGVFLSVQFLASVYLCVFLIIVISIYFFIKTFAKKGLFNNIKNFILIIGVFLLLDGFFIKSYIDTTKIYSIHREYWEYVQYSAHISDYIFSNSINSIIHNSNIINHWNRFNKHSLGEQASFPGFVLLFPSFITIFSFTIKNKGFEIRMVFKNKDLFFFSLIIIGFIFSIGPRLNVNGQYLEIPLLYHFFTKIPFLKTIRALARWSFIFYFGLTYYSLKFMKNHNKNIIFQLLLILILLEMIPINIRTYSQIYIDDSDKKLAELCIKKQKVVLEIPVTYFNVEGGNIEGLNYVSKNQLASTFHGCLLVNGYSGFNLHSILALDESIKEAAMTQDSKKMINALKQSKADIIKLNKDKIPIQVSGEYVDIFNKLTQENRLAKTDDKLYIMQ